MIPNTMEYNWSLISKYRSSLMGLGIIGVMLAHFLIWVEAKGVIVYALKPFIGLVFTEGFLLLSGLGLYYSFRKDSRLGLYYKKRIYRLLLPFLIISM